jgi:hypothetical protein
MERFFEIAGEDQAIGKEEFDNLVGNVQYEEKFGD